MNSPPSAAPAPAFPVAASPWRVWLDHHLYSLVSSFGRLLRKPWAAALTISVMALALSLPLGLWLALDNLQRLTDNLDQARQIDLFLHQDIDNDGVAALLHTLRERGDVAAVEHRTPADGLADLRRRGGLDDLADVLSDDNPLPHLVRVTPAGDGADLAAALAALPEVDLIQHDAQWRERLNAWLHFGARLAWVLGALLGAGAVLVVGNTVRLDILARREELDVLQLIGATDGFIRRPFLYLGAWYGLAAGLAAIALLLGAGAALHRPLLQLTSGYNSGFVLHGLGAMDVAAVLAGAMALGWLGAGAVTTHFLHSIRPARAGDA